MLYIVIIKSIVHIIYNWKHFWVSGNKKISLTLIADTVSMCDILFVDTVCLEMLTYAAGMWVKHALNCLAFFVL